jgi:hypothetical protein
MSVGGVMAFITLHEMLPLAFEYAGHRKAVAAVFVGMAAMSTRSVHNHLALCFSVIVILFADLYFSFRFLYKLQTSKNTAYKY